MNISTYISLFQSCALDFILILFIDDISDALQISLAFGFHLSTFIPAFSVHVYKWFA